MPVRIAIDARKLHDFGIGTYVRNLVSEFARQPGDETFVLICRPDDVAFVQSLGPRFEAWPDTSGNYTLREQLTVPLDLQRFQLAVYGMDNFCPQSTDWVRVTLFGGAPRASDVAAGLDDDWLFAPKPLTVA